MSFTVNMTSFLENNVVPLKVATAPGLDLVVLFYNSESEAIKETPDMEKTQKYQHELISTNPWLWIFIPLCSETPKMSPASLN